MDSERFRKLLDAPGPFASVYFDDSHDTHDAEAQLELKWRAVRERLEEQGADESVTNAIETARSWPSWEHLRAMNGRTEDEATAVLEHMVAAMLLPEQPHH